jgi:glycosyltransferase involved in cell wall biosynthesis
MKILMVLDHEFPSDIRVENEIKTLQSSGHEIHLACYTRINRPENELYEGITIYRKKIGTLTYKSSVACLRFPRYFRFWRRFLNSILKSEEFEAVHVHDLPLAKVGVMMKEKHHISLIIDLHENWPAALETALHTNTLLGRLLSSNRQWRTYEKHMAQRADRIITVVDEMKERITKLGIDPLKIIVLPNTLQKEWFDKSNTVPDPSYITLFYAGGVNIHRGLQIVINGLQFIRNKYSNVRLWIIGAGSYINHLIEITKQLDLEERVIFFGWKNLHEISELLSKSDIALIPHLKSEQTDNSSPNKLFQYMYFGKPILASNCSSIQRILAETQTGISYQNDSANDFADKLESLILMNDFSGYAERGIEAVRQKYNWEKTAESLINMYNQLQ